MKKLAIVLLFCGLFLSSSSLAQVMPTWDLSRDLQRSFTQRSDGVWYFMESGSLVHDPASYRLLPEYRFPCSESGFGLGCWQGSWASYPDGRIVIRTAVSFNFTTRLIGRTDNDAGFLPHIARLTPTWERLAIVAWQSPVAGTIKVSARFRERIPEEPACISMGWSIEKGAQTLKSGRIGPCATDDGARATISRLPVAKNDVLYFIVDDSWHASDYISDGVDLQVTITQVP
jgi:hypothetical protein